MLKTFQVKDKKKPKGQKKDSLKKDKFLKSGLKKANLATLFYTSNLKSNGNLVSKLK